MSRNYSKKAQDGILDYLKSDEEKNKKFIKYGNCIFGNEDVIEDSIAKVYGISAWYEQFILSDAFQELDNNKKAESFRLYEMLKSVLYSIHSCS